MKVAATTFAIEVFVPYVLQDPLGGGGVPLGGRVGVDDIEDGIEDEGEN